jgi:uncharacterized membrane protein YgaE (UPF0421/DUF939 family)
VLVRQPVLAASLRKASFRMIGTVVGAIGVVILAALFRQNSESFLVGLALWCATGAFVAALLRNFAAYAAVLSGCEGPRRCGSCRLLTSSVPIAIDRSALWAVRPAP